MKRATLRYWRRSPVLATQYALTIAVGVAAITAVISTLWALGFRPLPFRDSGRLVAVWARVEGTGGFSALSGPTLADYAASSQPIFSNFGAFAPTRLWIADGLGSESVAACFIAGRAFAALGTHVVLGRDLRADDLAMAASGKAVQPAWISYRLWRARYGGSASVLGQRIGVSSNAGGEIEGRLRIAGVLPPGAIVPLPGSIAAPDVWYLMPDPSGRSRDQTAFFGVGRLRPGVSVAKAQAALNVVAARIGLRYRLERRNRPVVETLQSIAQAPARRTLGLVALGVAMVFLIGCLNLTILMAAEGRRRRREIATRIALGAGHGRIWAEIAGEKCVLTLASLAAGGGLSFLFLRLLANLLPAAGLAPRLAGPPALNLWVPAAFGVFALGAALAWAALLVASATGGGVFRSLRSGAGSSATSGGSRWSLTTLAWQAAIGICLLAIAALATTAYKTLSVANLGPAPAHTLLLTIEPLGSGARSDVETATLNREILARLRHLPGARTVALASYFPPSGAPAGFLKQSDPPGTSRFTTAPVYVSPDFFRALGIPVEYGRGFDAGDVAGSEPVAIVNVEMARQNWPSPGLAVGSLIALGSRFQHPYRIVGVTANFTGFWARRPIPVVYLPQAQSPSWGVVAIVRARTPRAIVILAPQALAGMAVPASVTGAATIQQRWELDLSRPLARMVGMLLLALLGLALCAQGVYAVAAGTVEARRHELAVRSALGAPASRLAWGVTGASVVAVAAGATAGVFVSLALRPFIVQWTGPVAGRLAPIAISAILLALAATAGCYFPARAATTANPAEVLRRE